MHRLLLLALVLACLPARHVAAQSGSIGFEAAAEAALATRTGVRDSTHGVWLTVASADVDWQARDVNGYGDMTGKAAYAVLATQVVTLTFDVPVRLVALHAATITGEQTWTFTADTGAAFEANVSNTRTRIEPGAEPIRTLTITSSAGAFFPVLDDIEIGPAASTTPTATAPEQALAALTFNLYPSPVVDAARVLVEGVSGAVRVAVYDALGREVAVLHEGRVQGPTALALDARALAAGAYLLAVEHDAGRHTRTFVVAR